MIASVIIMGAGPGGLAAAMLLAARGVSVDLFERLESVGGRSGCIEIDGFRFDRGPTFFLYPRILREIFAACGRNLDKEIELIKLDPQYHLVFENHGDLRATPDVARMRSEIARFSESDSRNLTRFLSENRTKLDLFEPVLKQPFSSIRDLFSTPMLKALRLLKPFRSVDSDLRKFFSDPYVRLAFSFQSKYLGMSPFQCPSLFTILSYMEYAHGVYHPLGGCSQVMTVMARIAQEMGVRLHLNQAVDKVNFKGKKFVSIEAGGKIHRGDALVVNADFSHFVSRYVPQHLLTKWCTVKLAKKRFSCSTFMLYLGIKGQYNQLEHHTILLSEQYERFLDEIRGCGHPPANISIYIQNAGKTDNSLAPSGCSSLYILVPVSNQINPVDWENHKITFRKTIINRLEAFGLVNLEKRILVEKMVTPQDWQSELSVYKGATFNLSHCLNQMLMFRPNNRFEELDSVYLVGGGTHPGSGLPVIFEGARITSDLVANDLKLDEFEYPAMQYLQTKEVL